jgi:four helix bundle protein
MGSASELEYFLLLACDLHYLPPLKYQAIVNEVVEMRRMLNGLLSKVQAEKRLSAKC